MEDNIKKAVAVVIENDKGEILLTQRGRISRDEYGKWENCGGAVDGDETEEEAIKREVMEELGVELEITGILYEDTFTTDSGASWKVVIFSGKIDSEPKVQNKDENEDVQWFRKDNLKNVDLASYTKKDFEKFGWI
ncbi:MAG: NUDIX hydrolase [Patescibacteria group bacterium]|mgnify:CR=1 FL=1